MGKANVTALEKKFNIYFPETHQHLESFHLIISQKPLV